MKYLNVMHNELVVRALGAPSQVHRLSMLAW
jgi:hypothetical protein